MKKLLFGLLAAIAITACSNEETSQPTEISVQALQKDTPDTAAMKSSYATSRNIMAANPPLTVTDSIRLSTTVTPPVMPADDKVHVYSQFSMHGPSAVNPNQNIYTGILYDDQTGCYFLAAYIATSAGTVTQHHSTDACHGWLWAWWNS